MENYSKILEFHGENTTQIPYSRIITEKSKVQLNELFCPQTNNSREQFVFCGLLPVLISSIGIVGNVITIKVLNNPDSNAALFNFLIGLTRSDLCSLLVHMSCFGLMQVIKFIGILGTLTLVHPFIARYAYALYNIGTTSSTYFRTVIILERYVAVCQPFGTRKLCSREKTVILSWIIVLCSVLINLPRILQYDIQKIILVDTRTGREEKVLYDLVWSDIGSTYFFKKHYLFLTWFVFWFLIPFSLILYTDIFLGIVIVKAHLKPEVVTAVKRYEIILSKVSIALGISFLLWNGPEGGRMLMRYSGIKPGKVIGYVANNFILLNLSLNWMIYAIYWARFRYHFIQLVSLPWSGILEIKGILFPQKLDKEQKRLVVKASQGLQMSRMHLSTTELET